MGNEALNAPVCDELGMGVAHGFPAFVDGLATVLGWFTPGSFSFRVHQVRDKGDGKRNLYSAAVLPS